MAFGTISFPAHSYSPSTATSGIATPGIRNYTPILKFDASTNEVAYFPVSLPSNYTGGGLTCKVWWAADTATSGDVKWELSVSRIEADVDDLDSLAFATAQSATTTTASAAGEIVSSSIAFTDGAQMDSLAAGEEAVFKLERDATDAGDTLSGDAHLLKLVITEA